MATDIRRRTRWAVLISLLVAIAVTAVTPFVGGSGMDYQRLFRQQSPDWNIFINLRVPRTLLAFLVGSALSASGALFQALLRDPLATPSSLGVSAAASLGAVAAIALMPVTESRVPWAWIAALIATFFVIALVAGLQRSPRFSSLTLLLTGIAVNGICASIILLLHSLAGITRSFQITHWLMGSINAIEYSVLLALAAVILPSLLWMLWNARVLNVISYGDAWATGRGIDARRLTWTGFAVGAFLTGSTTSVTGPIAFVGLIVPHLLRRMVGPDHRVLMPVSMLGGGAFLVICDTVSRSILAPAEVPVGVATALLGGPFFVWLLWSR
jgi:iron complex transport system permease protein